MSSLPPSRKRKAMLAIMLALLFAAINQTIVATALPHIMLEIDSLEHMSWLFTFYILAAAIPALIIGSLSDLYGRKLFLQAGLLLLLGGCLLAGLAQGYAGLLVARLIQGLGSGAIMVTAFSSVGDLYPPEERGRWQGILGSVFGLASLFGPVLGGIIVEHVHWRWVFWSSLPLGLLALAGIALLLPAPVQRKVRSIDYAGVILMAATLLPLMLLSSRLGETGPLLAFSLLSLLLFIGVERRSESPILPMELFSNPRFTLTNLIVFLLGSSVFAVMMYLPLFLQGVIGMGATVSGSLLMLMTVSLVLGSSYAGVRLCRQCDHRRWAVGGLFLVVLGLGGVSQLHSQAPMGEVVACMLLIGVGLGIGMPVFNLGLQNAVEQSQLGVATASGQLSRQLGSSLGVSYMGGIMGQSLHSGMGESLMREALDGGLSRAFAYATLTLFIALVLVAWLHPRRATGQA